MPRLRRASSPVRSHVSASPDQSRPSARRWVLPVAATAVGVAVLVVLLRPYGDDIRQVARDTPPSWVVLLTVLSFVALVLRTEMWRVALRASKIDARRSQLHAANGGTMLVSLVNGYVAPAVKIAILRRMRTTRLSQLVVVDFAAALLEVLVAGALVLVAAFLVDIAWWIPVLLIGGGIVLLGFVYASHQRWEYHPAVQGLNVVVHSYFRYRLLGLLALTFISQILRTWLSYHAVGAGASLPEATLIFVLTGVLGTLPTGLAAAPTTASLLVLGRDGVASAATAGVLVTVSLFAATLIYTGVTAAVYFVSVRRTKASDSDRPASDEIAAVSATDAVHEPQQWIDGGAERISRP
jgi:hypothetical protein